MLPEQALISDLARAGLGGPAVAASRLALDPSHAITLADELGVLGFVGHQARRSATAHPLWLAAWRANLARNVRLSVELRRWWTILDDAGHRPVAFKGPALGRAAFGGLGRRDSCDLDLIASPFSFADAVALLSGMGLKARSLVAPADRIGAVTFEVPDAMNTYAIDLHRGWLDRWGGGPDGELRDEDLEPVEIAGATLSTLEPRRALIHAAIHFEQHDFMLKGLLDVAMTSQRAAALGLMTESFSLAADLGVRRTLDRALAAAESFVRDGEAAGLPRGRRSSDALTAPRSPALDLRRWRQLHPGYGFFRLLRQAARTVWPSEAHLRAAPEWVAPHRVVMRRLLRPVRLLLLLARRSEPRERAPTWRDRGALRFRSAENPQLAPIEPTSAGSEPRS